MFAARPKDRRIVNLTKLRSPFLHTQPDNQSIESRSLRHINEPSDSKMQCRLGSITSRKPGDSFTFRQNHGVFQFASRRRGGGLNTGGGKLEPMVVTQEKVYDDEPISDRRGYSQQQSCSAKHLTNIFFTLRQ
jgi:hypothetical protein